ncbi:MAG: TetR/AcrR family transcriptional regulator [Acidimicrobiaceae bacterium]|nr:TetR/AcrR family transcriptional regulator [Acidimicrobiaceae bacterium]
MAPSTVPETEESSRAGRPRDEAREQAILDAALELVAEVGMDRMSMDAVAARAKASKATIYRRWPGKTELVLEAIQRLSPTSDELADTGSLRGDLLAATRVMCANMSGVDGGLMCGLAAAIRNDAALGQALGRMHEAKEAVTATIVARAKARGELPDSTDAALISEVAPGVTLNRLLNGEPLDEPFVIHLVDRILLPLLHVRPSGD